MAVASKDPGEPAQLAVYRLLVGIGGLLLVCLGFVSGPIPGPGGIPWCCSGWPSGQASSSGRTS